MQLLKFLLATALSPVGLGVLAAPQLASADAIVAQDGALVNDAATVQDTATADGSADAQASTYGGGSLGRAEAKYRSYIDLALARRGKNAKCNAKNVIIRKEWGSMTAQQRKDYVKAVKCIYNKPARSSTNDVPGARNRLDDFVAAHIQQSNKIHFNGYLYSWHRHFVHLYDQALRTECGYKGPTPFWDWTLSSNDPRTSPLFDGTDTSMGGNGEQIPHGATVLTVFGLDLTLQAGTGGGCVKTGPFTDLTVNLGLTPNILPAVNALTAAPIPKNNTGINEGALQYNPRCLTRDINLDWSKQTSRGDVEYLLTCPDARCLEQRADGWENQNSTSQNGRYVRRGKPQVHPAGHFAIGGLQNDPFASPGDPIFYMHHAQLDRVWAFWQAQNPSRRTYQVGGTKTPFNNPESSPVALDDRIEFGVIGSPLRLRDGMSSIDGPYCYKYE